MSGGCIAACCVRARRADASAAAQPVPEAGGRAEETEGAEKEREEVFVLSFSHGKAFRLCGRQKGRCGY